MKTSDDIKKQASVFTEAEKLMIEGSVSELQSLLRLNRVNEEALQKLQNIVTIVENLKDSYMWRIIRLAKQNHMLD